MQGSVSLHVLILLIQHTRLRQVEQQRARPLDLKVGALFTHFEFAASLFLAFTFCLVLQMCGLYGSVLSRWTPRYTGVV